MEFEDWLDVRFDMDTRSRNKEVEDFVLTEITKKEYVNILDVGAGTASNFRYLSDKIPCDNQEWTLLDQEKSLLEKAKEKVCEKLGAPISETSNRLSFETDSRKFVLNFVVDDIFSSNFDAMESSWDLVVANAFFDLASREQMAEFFEKPGIACSAFLISINYTGMSFLPEVEEDVYWIDQYHHHMTRSRPSGASLGPACVLELSRLLAKTEMKIGASDWQMNGDHAVASGIFDFMEMAFQELGLDMEKFSSWRSSKLRSQLRVKHSDIAYKPSVRAV